jgi:L-Ala-D/L-Glu epimerase
MELRVSSYDLPIAGGFAISGGTQAAASVIEVEVHHEDHVGRGEAEPQAHDGQTTESARRALLAVSELLGGDPFALEEIEKRTRSVRHESAAMAALDAALHDLCGKVVGLPVWRLLGLARVGPPTALTVSLGTPDEMARNARGWMERFPDCSILKLKLGGGDGRDLDRVRAVRDVVDDHRLIVDVNAGWSAHEAAANVARLPALGVELVEQPLVPGHPSAPELKASSPLPIIADESCHRLSDVARAAREAHGINVKLVKAGGLREAVRMIHAARALGLRVMLGCMLESTLGIAAAAHLASLTELVDLDANLLLDSDPWRGLAWEDGRQVPALAPGLGVVRRQEGVGT